MNEKNEARDQVCVHGVHVRERIKFKVLTE